MEDPPAILPGSVLARLLALAPGTIAGLSPVLDRACPSLAPELVAFGPWASTEEELRFAARRPPARLVVRQGRIAASLVTASLALLGGAGTVVVLRSEDPGLLLDWADRILCPGASGLAWESPAAVRARRRLVLRVEPPPAGRGGGWVQVSLEGGTGPEEVLASFRAGGVRVCESRISYEAPLAR